MVARRLPFCTQYYPLFDDNFNLPEETCAYACALLRTPKWDDIDDLMEFINSAIEEGADIEYANQKKKYEDYDLNRG